MDMQQMQLVMDTILKMGELGGNAFYLWLLLDKALPVIGWMLALLALYKVGMYFARYFSNNEYLVQLRNMLDIGTNGYLTENEAQCIVSKVRNMMEKPEKSRQYFNELKAENDKLRKELLDLSLEKSKLVDFITNGKDTSSQ